MSFAELVGSSHWIGHDAVGTTAARGWSARLKVGARMSNKLSKGQASAIAWLDEHGRGEAKPISDEVNSATLCEPEPEPDNGWDAESLAAVDGVIAESLGRLSQEWQPLYSEDLGSNDRDVLDRLTAAGLAERRLRIGASIATATAPSIMTCTVVGDYLRRLPARIAKEIPGWADDEGRPVGIFCLDVDDRQQVRLTSQGVLAQQDLRSGDPQLVGHVGDTVRGITRFSEGKTVEGVVSIEPAVAKVDTAEVGTTTFEANEVSILFALKNASPRLMMQVELETTTRLTRKTLSPLLRRLEEAKYVHRPHGLRKGYTLTSAGKQATEQVVRCSRVRVNERNRHRPAGNEYRL